MKKKTLGVITTASIAIIGATSHLLRKKAEKESFSASLMEPIEQRKIGFYERYIKRMLDVTCASGAIIVFSPLYLGVAGLVKLKLGSPVLFSQDRPGLIGDDGKETIFKMYKFRSMTDERDDNGNLLPDEDRLMRFGAWLRSTSLDELPEAFNILNGTMSVIGPRPQLVRDMVFMSEKQRKRHTVKPGLSGLAQIMGRNAISWDDKLAWDLKYIEIISFKNDCKIVFNTIKKAFIDRDGITEEDMATAEDYGDYLLKRSEITRVNYEENQILAKRMMSDNGDVFSMNDTNHEPFSVAMSVYQNDRADHFDSALKSITIDQTIKPSEIVLVVDGPISKDINDVLEKYERDFNIFNVIRLEKNEGLGKALKVAVENAKYELIARMDSDDIAVPRRFEEQLQLFSTNSELDVVGGDIAEFIGDESNIIGKRVVPQNNDDICEYMKKRCAMNHVTVMFKKKAVLDAGGYQEWFWNEDYYLWIRLLLNNAIFANTGSVLVKVRVGKEMYKRRGGRRYYESEKALQEYMLNEKLIDKKTYYCNVAKRATVQLLMPNTVRSLFFKIFARKQ